MKNKRNISAFAIDIFCGVGGMTHGFLLEGIPVLVGIDADISCKYSFEKNNKAIFWEKNIQDLNGIELLPYYPKDRIKILIGCAPCQPFSKYTSKKSRDDKWALIHEFTRIIADSNPDIVSMENVPEVVKHHVFADFTNDMKSLGYQVSWKIVNCPEYGIPQTRKRLVFFASKYGNVNLVEPTHKQDNYLTVRQTIGHLPSIEAGETHRKDSLHRASRLSSMNRKRIRASVPGGSWRSWNDRLRLDCHKKSSGKTYPSIYGRMEWDKPSPTITTQAHGYGNGRFGHPEQDRALSLREAALLQTFPHYYDFIDPDQSFSISHIARHIGNAVPPQLGRIIAKSIKIHLEESHV